MVAFTAAAHASLPSFLTSLHGQFSVGVNIPLGSVSVSLKKINAIGAVNQVGRGTYQIGVNASTAAVLSTEPNAKSGPSKKAKALKTIKAAHAKKTKALATKKANSAAGTAATIVDVKSPTVEAEAALK